MYHLATMHSVTDRQTDTQKDNIIMPILLHAVRLAKNGPSKQKLSLLIHIQHYDNCVQYKNIGQSLMKWYCTKFITLYAIQYAQL